jgi:uncharacterized NAD(P)/FAD-binding protein YdhS
MPTLDLPIVAVVGGGFSGLMTALHLARSGSVRVRLIEKTANFAQGAAYSTANPDHLLNVRAANMSAWPDDPEHFARWLAARHPDDTPGFACRGEYGLYLQDLLAQAASCGEGRLSLVSDAAVGLARDGAGWRLEHASGAVERVDAVVLAVGNPPPATPAGIDPATRRDPRYHADPWRFQAGTDGDDDKPILLIGSGLTMVDVALSLTRAAPRRRIIALSRRGLSPLAHTPTSPIEPLSPPTKASPTVLLRWLKVRAHLHGWRETIDALRPWTQGIWRAWSPAQRASFLRHARPYWDVRRHRLAPDVATRIEALIQSGQLTLLAGRLTALEPSLDGLRLGWTARGAHEGQTLQVTQAINCTGPAGALATDCDPLLGALRDAGLVRSDPQQLGLDVDASGRLIGANGAPHDRLYAVGPITRGAFWEITAVPDIRLQAALAAEGLIAALTPAPVT